MKCFYGDIYSKDARHVSIKKSSSGTKFKVRCSRVSHPYYKHTHTDTRLISSYLQP
ncbi:hypothetical protein EON63_15600 [archaeon]|nr:MAG: hypothetical protein EON63_15600 [archaeon]